MAKIPHIFLGVPNTGSWDERMAVFAVDMAVRSLAGGIIVKAMSATGAYTETNRNNIVQAALTSPDPVDAIFWVDSDMEAPIDALSHLWSHGLDIVGASYRERKEPYRYLGRFLDEDDASAVTGVKPADLLPGGMMLVKTDVYRAVPYPWYKLGEDGFRDDYYFCQKAIEAGYKIWCDMDLTRKVVHIGKQGVGWFEEGEEIARRTDDPRWNVFQNPPRTGLAEPGGGGSLVGLRN